MHATILGVALGLLGLKVGWEVNPDRSVTYVIQLDNDDMDRFRAARTIESDIPPQAKNVRRVRIEFGTLPLRQDAIPTEASPPAMPLATRDGALRGSPYAQSKTPGQDSSKDQDWLLPPDERKAAKKQPAAAGKKGPETPSGKPGEPPSRTTETPRPWMPLPAAIAMCALLGVTVYSVWITVGTRRRYRRLLERHRRAGETANDP